MAYDVNQIVQVTTKFIPAALGFANFGEAVLIATETDAIPTSIPVDEYRDYTTTAEMLTDLWSSSSETYIAASKWLGAVPNTRQLRVWVKADLDVSYVDTLAKMRDEIWWYITLATVDLYDDEADTVLAAEWCDANESMFPSPTNDILTLTPGDATSMPYQLSALGYRHAFSTYHPTDRYAAFPILAWFATTNYQIDSSVITGEYKTITNVSPVDLTTTQYNALKEDDTRCGFVTDIDLQGSSVSNRYVNSITHSANGEYIDDVYTTDAFVNAIKTEIFNVVANQATKLGQTIAGQQAIITATQSVCEQYLANGFLGERVYNNPDTGLDEFTIGYEILTRPEDILTISESERSDRQSAPMRIRVFRAGAIHQVFVDITIY